MIHIIESEDFPGLELKEKELYKITNLLKS